MDKQNVRTGLITLGIPLGVGALSAALTAEGVRSFQDVQQSALTPPGFIFPIVWTVLYSLMGISLARIRQTPESPARTRGLSLFLFQLIVNFFWSIFFFNMRDYGLSLVWIILLWVLIGLMILSFYKTDAPAAWLQLPYFLWVSFATYLTYVVWKWNR